MTWHAVTSALTSFSFYQDSDKPRGIGSLKTLKKPIYFKIILITQGVTQSPKFKTKRMVQLGNY